MRAAVATRLQSERDVSSVWQPRGAPPLCYYYADNGGGWDVPDLVENKGAAHLEVPLRGENSRV